MARQYGYETGAVRYFIMSIFFNGVAMYIFGGGILAVLEAIFSTFEGGFIQGILFYFVTKYLPPTSVEQILLQIVLGSFIAAIKWYNNVPKIGR